jgi:hypothetical protein
MSSPRAAAARPGKARAKPVSARAGRKPTKATAKPPKPAGKPASAASAQAAQLATTIERALAAGEPGVIGPQALQALTGALCKAYAARIEAGEQLLPIAARSTVTPTEVMLVASGLLRAANLAVFELGMWQSWTGR